MNNLSSYCGLVDAKIRAYDEDLPVQSYKNIIQGSRSTDSKPYFHFVSPESIEELSTSAKFEMAGELNFSIVCFLIVAVMIITRNIETIQGRRN